MEEADSCGVNLQKEFQTRRPNAEDVLKFCFMFCFFEGPRDPSTWCVQVLRSPKEAFAAAMQSWRQRCEKCVCLQGDYVEK